MKKRVLSLVLAVILIVGLLPTVTFRDQRGVSVYHKNIAHCTIRTSLNRNSYIET